MGVQTLDIMPRHEVIRVRTDATDKIQNQASGGVLKTLRSARRFQIGSSYLYLHDRGYGSEACRGYLGRCKC